jgi:hypothetical protein
MFKLTVVHDSVAFRKNIIKAIAVEMNEQGDYNKQAKYIQNLEIGIYNYTIIN